MNTDVNTVRLLGVAQLFVIVGGVITERLLSSAVRSGGISDILVSISENLTRIRISNLVALVQSFLIVVLGVLYYFVFNKQYMIIALVALGCFLAAAITLAVSKIGAYALIPLSQEFVETGAPASSHFQTLGDFLYYGVDRRGSEIHMLFTGLGLILWSYLLYISKVIPRGLAVWGLVAIFLFSISALLQLYDRDFFRPAMILALPYAPY
jgi:uncharacterized membrane protein (UPF0136 family)